MPTPTYDLIASQVLSTSAASVTFSSIVQDYRDLVIVCNPDMNLGTTNLMRLRFNGDTATNYYSVSMQGTGTSTGSFSDNNNYIYFDFAWMDDSQRNLTILQFLDYSATDKHKSLLARTNNAAHATAAYAARWASTSAITAIEISSNVFPFGAGSTFYLYGISS